ncbi:minor tail protein [Gordonia phage Sour]|uniref:Uncharacterized protein n=1 Tax=Gordonia phage Sour TaxID=2182349 RepID=A0A2U8UKT4_9CAUD|nr:minor tail protein [Gordonia phage Sour]AWN04243.1 hypothetical protein PBI_SOUR_42 [Gordonia phage Sour]
MADLYIGDGTPTFDEMITARIGNSGASERVRVMRWNGSTYVTMWEKPMPYQAVTTAIMAGTGTSWANWSTGSPVAHNSYPYTIMSGSSIVIPGKCPLYRANITASGNHRTGVVPRYAQLRIMLDGQVLVEGAQSTGAPGTATASASNVDLYPGAQLRLDWRAEGNFFTRPEFIAGEVILQITPVVQI